MWKETHFLCWRNFISLESYPSLLSGINSTTGINSSDGITGINSTTGIDSKLESTQLRNGVGIGIGITEFQKMPKIRFRNRFHCRNHKPLVETRKAQFKSGRGRIQRLREGARPTSVNLFRTGLPKKRRVTSAMEREQRKTLVDVRIEGFFRMT